MALALPGCYEETSSCDALAEYDACVAEASGYYEIVACGPLEQAAVHELNLAAADGTADVWLVSAAASERTACD